METSYDHEKNVLVSDGSNKEKKGQKTKNPFGLSASSISVENPFYIIVDSGEINGEQIQVSKKKREHPQDSRDDSLPLKDDVTVAESAKCNSNVPSGILKEPLDMNATSGKGIETTKFTSSDVVTDARANIATMTSLSDTRVVESLPPVHRKLSKSPISGLRSSKHSSMNVSHRMLPLDFSLKTELIFQSQIPFDGIHISSSPKEMVKSLRLYQSSSLDKLASSSVDLFSQLYYYTYPSLTPELPMTLLLKKATYNALSSGALTRPLPSAAATSAMPYAISTMSAPKPIEKEHQDLQKAKEYISACLLEWRESFDALYHTYLHGLNPYFYIIGSDGSLMFTKDQHQNPLCFLLHPSSRLKNLIDHEEISYERSENMKTSIQDTTSVLNHPANASDHIDSESPIKNSSCSSSRSPPLALTTSHMDAFNAIWRDSSEPPTAKPFSPVSPHRKLSSRLKRQQHSKNESLLLRLPKQLIFRSSSVHSLFNLLLNDTPVDYQFPKLYAPYLFPFGQLMQGTCQLGKPVRSGASTEYRLHIKGVLFCHQIHNIMDIFKANSFDCDMTVMQNTEFYGCPTHHGTAENPTEPATADEIPTNSLPQHSNNLQEPLRRIRWDASSSSFIIHPK